MSTGERLREQRLAQKLTLGQVAKYEGITAQYLSGLERGVKNPSTWRLLAGLADRYGCSTDYLLQRVDEPALNAGTKTSTAVSSLRTLAAQLSPDHIHALLSQAQRYLEEEAEERRQLARESATVAKLLAEIESYAGETALQRLLPLIEELTEQELK